MKKLALLFVAIGIIFFAFIEDKEKYPTIEIGTKAPMIDYKMKLVEGKELSIDEIKLDNGMCVVFSCNTCPFVVGSGDDNEGWEGRYNEVAKWCKENKVGVVFVNSNEAKRGGDDSMEEMVKHANENDYQFYYAEDKDSKLANAFGAKSTPHVFLFNKALELVYKGAIDDNNASAAQVKTNYLNDAILNLAQGKTIDPNTTKAIGCSIKRN